MAKKGYNYPIKKKIPLILLLNLFGITIIAKFLRLVNIFSKILSKYLLGGRKEPPLCKGRWLAKQDGGIVKAKFLPKTIPQSPLVTAPFTQGSLFCSSMDLSIFLTSTAFVDTNAKYGIPLLRYTVFLQNCPLENEPKRPAFFVPDGRERRRKNRVLPEKTRKTRKKLK